MKIRIFSLILFLLVFLIPGLQSVFASTIMGIVYDNRRNRLADVDIELLDDLSRTRNRTKTDGSGRYQFSGLGDGRYIVRVLPFKYDLAVEEQIVEISTVSVIAGDGAATIIQDFCLVPKKSNFAEMEASVIFAQEIPKEAKAAFDKAIDNLIKGRPEEGIVGLQQAIRIFPNYFLALQNLGREYFLTGKFAEAVPLLIKAADVNNKSPLSFYLLGYSLHKLGLNKAAVVALRQAADLNPASSSIFFALGTAERLEGQFVDAETHLKRSKKLSQTPFPDLHWQLALLYGENLKRYSEAADEFEEFLKARPRARDAEKIKKIIRDYRNKAKQKI